MKRITQYRFRFIIRFMVTFKNNNKQKHGIVARVAISARAYYAAAVYCSTTQQQTAPSPKTRYSYRPVQYGARGERCLCRGCCCRHGHLTSNATATESSKLRTAWPQSAGTYTTSPGSCKNSIGGDDTKPSIKLLPLSLAALAIVVVAVVLQ